MIINLEQAAKDRLIRFNVFKRVKVDTGTDALLIWVQHLSENKEFYYFGTERNGLFAALEKTDAPTTELFATRFEKWAKDMQAKQIHQATKERLEKRKVPDEYLNNPNWGMF